MENQVQQMKNKKLIIVFIGVIIITLTIFIVRNHIPKLVLQGEIIENNKQKDTSVTPQNGEIYFRPGNFIMKIPYGWNQVENKIGIMATTTDSKTYFVLEK